MCLVRRIEQIGVRPVMSAARIAGVIETLESHPLDLPDEFRLRRNTIDKQIHSGYPKRIAAAVRDLTWRETAKYLTEADNEALAEARALLITEVALALEQAWEQAENLVDDANPVSDIRPPGRRRARPGRTGAGFDRLAIPRRSAGGTQ